MQHHMLKLFQKILDIDINEINVIQGNSLEIPKGSGTGGSRSMPVGGNALYLASKKFLENTKESLANYFKTIQIKYYIKRFF